MSANTYGRQVVVPLVNKRGSGVIAGDVVIVDTSNNDAFTTTTSAATTNIVGVAQETIASNATGRILIQGYAALVNVNASVTRGNYGATHTVAAQAADVGSSRVSGAFCKFLTGGTTPDALVWNPDLGGASLTNPMTTAEDIIYGGAAGAPTRKAIGAAGGKLGRLNGVLAYDSGTSVPSATTGDRYWRTDLGLEIYYDGTRWLTTQVMEMTLSTAAVEGQTASVVAGHLTPWGTAYDIWMVEFDASLRVATTNNGTNFWTAALRLLTSANGVTSTPVTHSTAAIAADTTTLFRTTIGAAWTVATDPIADILLTKTLAPGALSYAAFSLKYRLIVT